jgi:hypothetical protein
MIRRRSAFEIEPQTAISSRVRAQPLHRPVARSITHTFVQGVSIFGSDVIGGLLLDIAALNGSLRALLDARADQRNARDQRADPAGRYGISEP